MFISGTSSSVIPFAYYSSIRFFLYVLSASIFYSKIVWFPLHSVLLSLSILNRFLSRSFFRSSSYIVELVCCCLFLVFLFQFILEYIYVLRIFAYCRSCFICFCSLISHSGFVFLFGFLRDIITLSLAGFAPVYLRSFSPVMMSIVISFNNLFTNSVFPLIFLVLVSKRWQCSLLFSQIYFIDSTFFQFFLR